MGEEDIYAHSARRGRCKTRVRVIPSMSLFSIISIVLCFFVCCLLLISRLGKVRANDVAKLFAAPLRLSDRIGLGALRFRQLHEEKAYNSKHSDL